MTCRTDLAVEATEHIKSDIEGVNIETYRKENLKITKITITTDEASEIISKPKGCYITADIPIFTDNIKNFPEKAGIMSKELNKLLPKQGLVLVVGLGNADITADNLGPTTVNNVLATRHISKELKKSISLDKLRDVAVLAPGVLGKTGIESFEILSAISKKIKPSALIVIDAFATADINRLGSTIQISNTGISPGSGVQNKREEINKNTMGIPVISMGVPTVVDAITLANNINRNFDENFSNNTIKQMIVTPKEIDLLIQRASKFLSITLNSLLQPEFSSDDIETLLK